MFRPSDDACALPFLVPANAMAVVELRHTAALLRDLDNLTAASANPASPANPAIPASPVSPALLARSLSFMFSNNNFANKNIRSSIY